LVFGHFLFYFVSPLKSFVFTEPEPSPQSGFCTLRLDGSDYADFFSSAFTLRVERSEVCLIGLGSGIKKEFDRT
jgi:hypothetical protein